ncbi:hypothetical protein KA005_13590, partial [bacterium]|nr:hypothetical protein [bacterium]
VLGRVTRNDVLFIISANYPHAGYCGAWHCTIEFQHNNKFIAEKTMAERSIRFGITDGEGHRASTWKLWTVASGSDIYLACRALGGKLKTSLHESGSWHIAYTQEAFKEKVEGVAKQSDRFIEKWPRPKAIAKGVTLAYRIVTPWSSVTSSIGEAERKRKIDWITNAPKPKSIEIDVIITARTTRVTGWPGKRSMGTSLVGSFQLENGETVWVVYKVIDMPDLSSAMKGKVRFYKGMGPQDLKGGNLRPLAYGREQDGSRVVYDCVVQRKRN